MNQSVNQALKSNSVLVVTNSLHIGGTETHLCQVLPELQRWGFDISVFLVSGTGPLVNKLEAAGIKVVCPRSYFTPLTFWQLFKYLRQTRPDIVQFMLPKAYLLGGIASVLSGRHTLIMCRRSLNNYQQKYPFLRKIEHWLHSKMRLIIANSQQTMQQLANMEHVTSDKLKLIYNGIDLQRFVANPSLNKNAIRQHFRLPPSDFTMVVVANLIPYKGHITLLNALGQIQRNLPYNWQLLCVGQNTSYATELQNQTSRLNMTRNVYWLGQQKAVEQLLAIADVAISCSYEEGFSNAVLEAMAAGAAVIATDVGGNPEAVLNGETGLIVPPKDSEALGQAIVRLASDPALRKAFGVAGRARVQQHFGLDTCVAGYRAAYAEALEAN